MGLLIICYFNFLFLEIPPHCFPQWLLQFIFSSSAVPFSPYPCQHLSSCVFFIIAFLTSLAWCLIVVLSCISLIISDIEHLFMYLLAICIFSLKKVSVQFLCPFLNQIFVCCFCLSLSLSLAIEFYEYVFYSSHIPGAKDK